MVTERYLLRLAALHISAYTLSVCACTGACMSAREREREYKHKPTFMQSFFNFISHLFVMMVQVQAELSSYTVY